MLNIILVLDRYCRQYSKRSSNWSVVKIKEAKKFEYMVQLKAHAFRTLITPGIKLTAGMPIGTDDPRLISATIAAVFPPPTQEIVERQKSRFN